MGVKASQGKMTEPLCYLKDHRWHGPPGYVILSQDSQGMKSFLIACPRCGEIGAARQGQHWTPTSGDWDDVTSLSLSPSIAKSCCGWHGYLTNGEFVPC